MLSDFVRQKIIIHKKNKDHGPCILSLASGLLQIGCKLKNWWWCYNSRHGVVYKLTYIIVFLASSLDSGPSFILILLLLFLELWQFVFVRVLTRNLRIEKTHHWTSCNSRGLEQKMDSTFGGEFSWIVSKYCKLLSLQEGRGGRG